MTPSLADGPPAGMADPLLRLPSPPGPSARREVSLEIAPDGEWSAGAIVRGRSRDVVRAADGSATTVAEAELEVRTDGAWVLLEARIPGQPEVSDRLVGRAARGGFRAGLADLAEVGFDPASPYAGLLDDLPTVRLIAGYAQLMEADQSLGGGSPKIDVCSGWRADGSAVRRALGGRPLLGSAATVPSIREMLADDGDFLAEVVERPRTMRRRRVLTLTPGAAGDWQVWAYLRDSHLDRAGAEHGLHEYVVTGRAEGADLRLQEVEAEPRTLPFADCPLASPNVERLAGIPAGDIEQGVTGRLPGASGCTHLNDVLRTFRFLPRLATQIGAAP